jgi:hypothetical protein
MSYKKYELLIIFQIFIFSVLSFAGVGNEHTCSQVINQTDSYVGALQFYFSITITNQMLRVRSFLSSLQCGRIMI